MIHYCNPRMVVGALARHGRKILLCRRAIEPRYGKWTLPAGYLENGETIAECATRETLEEAQANLVDLQPYALLNLPFINQIYFIFLCRLRDLGFKSGEESLEVRLFEIDQIPWSDLAFTAIHDVLHQFVEDEPVDSFPFRVLDVAPIREA